VITSKESLERIHRALRRVLERNDLEYFSFKVIPAGFQAIGSIAVNVEVQVQRTHVFGLTLTVFDSDDELAVRISRGVESLNLRHSRLAHEFIYCWCGHSGDTRQTEKGLHYLSADGLVCDGCSRQSSDGAEPARPKPMRCPSCDHGCLPFLSPFDPVSYCDRCNGLGFLKPAFYRSPEPAGVVFRNDITKFFNYEPSPDFVPE
jgi:hypothetical protein